MNTLYSNFFDLFSSRTKHFSTVLQIYFRYEVLACEKTQKKKETNITGNKTSKNYQSTTCNESQFVSNPQISSPDKCGHIKISLLKSRFKFLFQWTGAYKSEDIPFYFLLLAILSSTLLYVMLLFGYTYFQQWWFVSLGVVLTLVTLFSLLFITAFKQESNIETFKVSHKDPFWHF